MRTEIPSLTQSCVTTRNVPLKEDIQTYFEREGEAARPRCVDRRVEDEGRLRDSV